MINIVSKKNCCGCKACQLICPKNCVKMVVDDEGFWYPNVDKEKCINCGLCEKSCPILNKQDKSSSELNFYAAYSNNDDIRINSSSGGIFSELAINVLEKNGIVFGCTMNDDFSVSKHIKIQDVNELYKLRGSKYLQSDVSCTYEEIKYFLKNNKKVLFSGTPCQVAGLKSFLGDYSNDSNLVTVDIICHGTPSPKIWNCYKANLEKSFNSDIKNVSFRNKSDGWQKYSLLCEFKNNKEYKKHSTEDLYLRGFVADYYLRPSCYDCQFKGDNIKSDITLADFWGIDKVNPQFNDNKGTSLVIIHSPKGQQIFDDIIDNKKIAYFVDDAEKGLNFNPSYYNSVKKKSMRKTFFKQFRKNGAKAFEICCGFSIKSQIIRKINSLKDKLKSQEIK